MAYKALVDFTDLDTGKVFLKGDPFPVDGLSKQRLKELTSTDNKRKEVVIAEDVEQKPAETKPKPKKVTKQSKKDK